MLVPLGVRKEGSSAASGKGTEDGEGSGDFHRSVNARQAPERMRLRRFIRSPRPNSPESHQSNEPCAGEFGGLLMTTFSLVVNGG